MRFVVCIGRGAWRSQVHLWVALLVVASHTMGASAEAFGRRQGQAEDLADEAVQPHRSVHCDTVVEGTARTTMRLSCANTAHVITNVPFASWGGSYFVIKDRRLCGQYRTFAGCHAPNSLAVVRQQCLGKHSCTLDLSDKEWVLRRFSVDPCPGNVKGLSVVVRCADTQAGITPFQDEPGCDDFDERSEGGPRPAKPPPVRHVPAEINAQAKVVQKYALYSNSSGAEVGAAIGAGADNTNAAGTAAEGDEGLEAVVTIIVKYMSRFRAAHMADLHASIRLHFPKVRVLVGDDTFCARSRPLWAYHPHTSLVALPADAGLALGRNILVRMVRTPFLVLLEDDFVFTKFTDLQRMLRVLVAHPSVDIVGGGLAKGSLTSSTFESYGLHLQLKDDGTAIFAKGGKSADDGRTLAADEGCTYTDVVFNFFMARTQTLLQLPWNPLLKVGEHEPFFLALKLHGRVVVECPAITIYHNVTRSHAYKTQSHRYDLHKFARHICTQFDGLRVMSSIWWSIVCSPVALFCSRDRVWKPYETICSSLKPPHYARFSTYRPPFYGDVLLPAIPAARTLPKTRIFVAVITHCANVIARTSYRRFVFTQKCGARRCMRDGNMQYRFFIGKPRNGCSLTAEEMGLRDIVVLREADDGYENLVDKVTTTMRWISQNVVAEVALKVDDDVFVSLPSILKRYMHFRTNYMDRRGRVSRLYMGAVTPFGLPATRYKHKWYLPSSQYSQPKLPTYCNGPAYMVSLDAAAELGRHSDWVRRNPFRLEDVFMSLPLAEIDIFAASLQPPGTSNFIMSLHILGDQQLFNSRADCTALHSIGDTAHSFPLLNEVLVQYSHSADEAKAAEALLPKIRTIMWNEARHSAKLASLDASVAEKPKLTVPPWAERQGSL